SDSENWFQVDVSDESLSKTTIGDWQEGRPLNLEMALKMGDELGGHIVSGHVDGLGGVISISPVGESLKLEIEVSPELGRLIAPKGSVTIDGVSLTTNEISEKDPKNAKNAKNDSGSHIFSINIIPHTQQMTTLGKLCAGDKVNVEIDTLARYVARLQDTK
ncbi:MAG: riboflavin synthase, partial [Rhodospirillaceae bacterium]|nr:riboflavin synthase [Rhodospirillaceae bacterium]